MSGNAKYTRRSALKGLLGGGAVTVSLPVLECFLNPSGTAFAATNQALPPIFGTWFWGCGLIPGLWEPKKIGSDFELPAHISSLEPIRSKLNVYSGMQVFLDGKVNQNHYSGAQCQMTGMVSKTGSEYTTSIDTLISQHFATRTRFRSIEISCDGDRRSTWSARSENGMNPAEISPLTLYARIFGPDFRDPNAAEFVPDPALMVRKSVLSGVAEQRRSLLKTVSATDRARLDDYFTSVRELEQKLAVELERPAPLPTCRIPERIDAENVGTLVDQVRHTHKQFAQLLAHALSCGQTRIFNVAMGSGFSTLRKFGEPTAYHQLTHEEPVNPELGYQPTCKFLAEQHMAFLSDLALELDRIREGDATLLDRTILYAYTDHGEARLHSMKRYPLLTIGSGGGRLKTGNHVAAEGDAVTRVALTVQQAFGMNVGSFGTETNQVNRPFSEVLA
jgi:Protein of unknown function (DUF1552)